MEPCNRCPSLKELTTTLTYSPRFSKKWYHYVANFFRYHYFIRIGLARIQKAFASRKVVVRTRNEIKASEKGGYLKTDLKVVEIAGKTFPETLKEGTVTSDAKMRTLKSGKCWGATVHLAKAVLHEGPGNITKIASQYQGGIPKEGVELHDIYEHRHGHVRKALELTQEDAKLVNDCIEHVEHRLSNSPLWVANEVPSGTETFKDKIFKAIDETINTKFTNYFETLKNEIVKISEGKELSENELKILKVFAAQVEDYKYGYIDHEGDIFLRKAGLNTIESVVVNFQIAKRSFASLTDGVYFLSIPCYGVSKFVGRHAIGLIVDKGTTYFYDPNFAIWETTQKDASSLGAGIIWEYMHPGAVYNSEIFITKVGLAS